MDGLVVVDKEAGWTSHDVVAKLRGILHTKKVGHSGTLDPDATGVLLVGVGRVTRLLRFLTVLPKTYTGEVVLGVSTSTLDASGGRDRHPRDARDARRRARRRGHADRRHPASAADGVGRADRRQAPARARPRRHRGRARGAPVTVHRFDVDATDDPLVYRVEVECSSGTYIRSLAADVGAALGGGGHLRNLRRTAIGSFTLSEARTIDAIDDGALLPPAAALRDYPSVVATLSCSAAARCWSEASSGSTATGRGRSSTTAAHCSPCTNRTAVTPSSPPCSSRSLRSCRRCAPSTRARDRPRAPRSPSARTTACTAGIAR